MTFSVFLGLVALVEFHYRVVANRKKGEWQYSVFTLALLALTIGIAIVLSTDSDIYQNVWFYFNGWPYLAALAISGLYQISASFRAMRAKSTESTIVLILTFIVVLAQMPLASIYLPQLGPISDWLLKYASSGALAGITIGIGVGAVALGYRLLLGKEKTLSLEADKGA